MKTLKNLKLIFPSLLLFFFFSCNDSNNSPTDSNLENTSRISISLTDGPGDFDNVFIERLWRSVKYEEVYLHAYQNMDEGRDKLKQYFSFYNTKRRHQTLGCFPDTRYYQDLTTLKSAA